MKKINTLLISNAYVGVNLLKLEIGQQVRINRKATFEYTEENERQLIRTECPESSAIICGMVKKGEGKWHKGSHGWDGDYDPPTFTVTRYYWLYECRVGIHKKPFLVHPSDILETISL